MLVAQPLELAAALVRKRRDTMTDLGQLRIDLALGDG